MQNETREMQNREATVERLSDTTLSDRVFWTAVIFALLFPTVLTGTYFVLLSELPTGVQQAVYGAGKLVQFGFPLCFVLFVLGRQPRWHRPVTRGTGVGIAFGLAVMLAALLLYHSWLKPNQYLQGLESQVLAKVQDLGLGSLWKYAAVGIFYSLAHSLLEEYYWRWFVFGQLQPRLGTSWANLISSAGFMAHHVVLLGTFFGWNSPLAYLFSLAVAIGGAFWAWLYAWSRSLLGPWLSHMLIDAAIFLIGYDLVRNAIT
jgi:membrane protease YdiL (CAAX protease family)